jgi:hypothetical protein
MHAGCHSFERFFDPRWETVFAIGRDMIEKFQLERLAQTLPSRGVHLAMLNRTMTGEWLGRKVALKIMGQRPTPLLLSTHCDIQALPEWHALHVPYDKLILRMVHEFLQEDIKNEILHDSNIAEINHLWNASPLDQEICSSAFSAFHRPLLVLNTAMVESMPSTKHLQGSRFHSRQVGLVKPWENASYKPDSLAASQPWISDVSTWVEDHMALYNTSMLAQIVDKMAAVHDTVSMGVKAIPQILCQKAWKAVRLNDAPMFYDFAKSHVGAREQTDGKEKIHILLDPTKYPSISTFDWILNRSLTNLPQINSPLYCHVEYMRLRIYTNMNVQVSCIIARSHLQPNHIPKETFVEEIVGNQQHVFNILMRLFGYEFVKRTSSQMIYMIFPGHHSTGLNEFAPGMHKYIRKQEVWFANSNVSLTTFSVNISAPLRKRYFFKLRSLRSQQKSGDTTQIYHDRTSKICGLVEEIKANTSISLPMVTADEVLRVLQPVAQLCEFYFSRERSSYYSPWYS